MTYILNNKQAYILFHIYNNDNNYNMYILNHNPIQIMDTDVSSIILRRISHIYIFYK